ncbi:hypothetical protein [Methylobacterium sp. J-067]|uniref:hypothetical protein n=1 Tax=Methylobacterium sp. J-067 TaxID=2836648 RepID=UPI001FB9E4CA|nr:hypothetical protein [Methylobacterium sp. J-067]MCJ2023980.1 hypothetical protein [Methylobacterium sp. J-067]
MYDDGDAPDYENNEHLTRIAGVLGVPVARFFATGPLRFSGQMGAAASREEMTEALAVMRLYLRLQSPEARARCITFITEELLRDR